MTIPPVTSVGCREVGCNYTLLYYRGKCVDYWTGKYSELDGLLHCRDPCNYYSYGQSISTSQWPHNFHIISFYDQFIKGKSYQVKVVCIIYYCVSFLKCHFVNPHQFENIINCIVHVASSYFRNAVDIYIRTLF